MSDTSDSTVRLRAGGSESIVHDFTVDTAPADWVLRFALTASTDAPEPGDWQDGQIVASEETDGQWAINARTPEYDLGPGGIPAGAYYLHREIDGAEEPRHVVATVLVLGADWA